MLETGQKDQREAKETLTSLISLLRLAMSGLSLADHCAPVHQARQVLSCHGQARSSGSVSGFVAGVRYREGRGMDKPSSFSLKIYSDQLDGWSLEWMRRRSGGRADRCRGQGARGEAHRLHVWAQLIDRE